MRTVCFRLLLIKSVSDILLPKNLNVNATKIHLHKFTCVSHKVKILNLVVFRAYFRPKETKPTVLKYCPSRSVLA